jgi:hypothetical protein
MERSKTQTEILRPKLMREQTSLTLNQPQTGAGSSSSRSTNRTAIRATPVQDAKNIEIFSIYNKSNPTTPSTEESVNGSAASSALGKPPPGRFHTSNPLKPLKSAYMLSYQAPLVSARLPRSLFGKKISIEDSNELRQAIGQKAKNNLMRKRQYDELSQQFLNEIEVNDYFCNKSNWLNKSKFINTNSYFSAVKVYFPLVKSNQCNQASTKYIELQRNRQHLEDIKYYK